MLRSSHEGGRAAIFFTAACCGYRAWLVVTKARVRAALPLRRGRLLSESWKPRQYHAGPWPGAAGIRRDWYFGDS